VTADWEQVLDPARRVIVRIAFVNKRRAITNYSVVLTSDYEGRELTAPVYDGAHKVKYIARLGLRHRDATPAGEPSAPARRRCRPRRRRPADSAQRRQPLGVVRLTVVVVGGAHRAKSEFAERIDRGLGARGHCEMRREREVGRLAGEG
jgi:hypothetical protein